MTLNEGLNSPGLTAPPEPWMSVVAAVALAVAGGWQETLGRQLAERLGVEVGVGSGACPDPRTPAFITHAALAEDRCQQPQASDQEQASQLVRSLGQKYSLVINQHSPAH